MSAPIPKLIKSIIPSDNINTGETSNKSNDLPDKSNDLSDNTSCICIVCGHKLVDPTSISHKMGKQCYIKYIKEHSTDNRSYLI